MALTFTKHQKRLAELDWAVSSNNKKKRPLTTTEMEEMERLRASMAEIFQAIRPIMDGYGQRHADRDADRHLKVGGPDEESAVANLRWSYYLESQAGQAHGLIEHFI